jgi:predicted NBD/HSP70 family sugar kinase
MSDSLAIDVRHKPELDPGFVPAVLWNAAYRARTSQSNAGVPLSIALERSDGTVSRTDTYILPYTEENAALNRRYVERMVKFLLWQKGGHTIYVGGSPRTAEMLSKTYAPEGERAFDFDFMGRRMYGQTMRIVTCSTDEVPMANEAVKRLGRNLDGCRIGFDLGGSDRKCAALIDGEVVHSEEVEWNPYFESNPQYHIDGIRDTLNRAAAHLPRVDAIGGSSAGCYVNNEVRVASLFRGISEADFDARIKRVFFDLQEEWGGVPFEVANDGEVTALAGSMSLDDNAVLGVSMGTSQAVGYCTPDGCITPWLNELAFAPIDYREHAAADEWSGDIGCGVQYFSQQGVARLAPLAGLHYGDMPFAEQLIEVQKLMAAGDERAAAIYRTIGTYFGYTIAHYSEFYSIRNLLILGRVTSGEGGEMIIRTAQALLEDQFPGIAAGIALRTPSEKDKRHGQAIAAASLPAIERGT